MSRARPGSRLRFASSARKAERSSPRSPVAFLRFGRARGLAQSACAAAASTGGERAARPDVRPQPSPRRRLRAHHRSVRARLCGEPRGTLSKPSRIEHERESKGRSSVVDVEAEGEELSQGRARDSGLGEERNRCERRKGRHALTRGRAAAVSAEGERAGRNCLASNSPRSLARRALVLLLPPPLLPPQHSTRWRIRASLRRMRMPTSSRGCVLLSLERSHRPSQRPDSYRPLPPHLAALALAGPCAQYMDLPQGDKIQAVRSTSLPVPGVRPQRRRGAAAQCSGDCGPRLSPDASS